MENLSLIQKDLDIVTKKYVDDIAKAKVNKVEGKGLSTNDFTNEEKQKLADLSESGYTLPVASTDAIGGVKSGTDITVDTNGNVSVNDNSHDHTLSNISDLTVTANELNYVDGVTSNIQTQLNAKAATSTVLTKTNTTSYTPTTDYNPATKKYVDDAITNAITSALEASY